METTGLEEAVILKTMSLLPQMARDQDKDYAKRITSKVGIDGTITFGIVLPQGGRADVGTIRPLELKPLAMLNALGEMLAACDDAWLIMLPTAPASTNTENTERLSPAEIKRYEQEIQLKADKQIQDQQRDLRNLFNTAPKVEYFCDTQGGEYVNYNGLDMIIPYGVVSYIPEPWYNVLMESKEGDRKRGRKIAKLQQSADYFQLDQALKQGVNE
jgi:hypothetical protein